MANSAPKRTPACHLITVEKRGVPETGTVVAILDVFYSCDLASRDTPKRKTWGGARNHSGRVNDYLSRRQCEDILAAASYAQATGRIFSRHWTIHYGNAGIPDSEGAAFVRSVLKRAGEHVRRSGGEMAAIWVRENGEGKGPHVHILLSLPDGYHLTNRTRRWIEAAGGAYRRGVSEVRRIGGTLASASEVSERHFVNVQQVLAYLMKAATNETGTAVGLERCGASGAIIGKRCGCTLNLGNLARRTAHNETIDEIR